MSLTVNDPLGVLGVKVAFCGLPVFCDQDPEPVPLTVDQVPLAELPLPVMDAPLIVMAVGDPV